MKFEPCPTSICYDPWITGSDAGFSRKPRNRQFLPNHHTEAGDLCGSAHEMKLGRHSFAGV